MSAPSATPVPPARSAPQRTEDPVAPDPVAPVDVAPDDVGRALAALRERRPLVHCVTSHVVASWTANALLAVGARPALADHPDETGDLARLADALLVNLGTPQEHSATAIAHAVTAAERAATPWVLDPVGVGGPVWRTRTALDLLARYRPTIIRGNASEIL